MAFSSGFEKVAISKEAFISAALGLAGRGLAGLARPLTSAAIKGGGLAIRGANRVLGGTIGTAMTGLQAGQDYKKYKNMMNGSVQR